MIWLSLAAVAALAALTCYWMTGWVLQKLQRRRILDRPTARSSHAAPTPRGGGLAITAVAGSVWLAIALATGADFPSYGLLLLWLGLAAVSFLDDVRGLAVLPRLAAQILAVAVGLSLLPQEVRVLQGLVPFWPDRILAALIWLWFVNLYNFMDGIDGLAAVETASLGIGVAAIATIVGLDATAPLSAAAIAGAAIGFGIWNWPPAKLFMGDVGSIGLGFVLGWLLLQLASAGQWLPALILPLYHLADASLTLLLRLLRRQPVWRAHSSHFYQRAARRFSSHAAVALRVGGLNAVLIAIALGAAVAPDLAIPCAIAAVAVCGLLLWRFNRNH